jgi:Pup-ligase protein.
MSETTALLKVGAADLVLRMLESGMVMRDMSFENPIRAIREISHDTTGTRQVPLSTGRELSALQMQWEYLDKVTQYVDRRGLRSDPTTARVLDLWERSLKAVEAQDFSAVDTEIDWVIKREVLQRYMDKHDLSLSDTRIAQLDLAYHDIRRDRGLFYLLERRGLARRVTHDPEVFEAKNVPPQTTRAKLRGDFVRRAQERRRDFTVDWVHLKLNDQAQRTVLCKDPFASADDRVDRLLASM